MILIVAITSRTEQLAWEFAAEPQLSVIEPSIGTVTDSAGANSNLLNSSTLGASNITNVLKADISNTAIVSSHIYFNMLLVCVSAYILWP